MELKKRLLSLAWRAGAASIVAAIAVLFKALPELGELGTPVIITAIIGLFSGEVTKFLNKKYKLGAKVLGAFKRK